jgi:hypothetical protein
VITGIRENPARVVPAKFSGRAVTVVVSKRLVVEKNHIGIYIWMADYGDGPRHKYVVGVHNPDVPNPWDYALSHDFDFACTFISRPQLQTESIALGPDSSDFNITLCRNALLRPSGIFVRQLIGMDAYWIRSSSPYAGACIAMA